MRLIGVLIVLLAATTTASSEVRVIDTNLRLGGAPRLDVVLEVTPNARPASDYLLEVDRPDLVPIRASRLSKGDPRRTVVAIVVDTSPDFLADPAMIDKLIEELDDIGDERTIFSVVANDVVVANASSPRTTLKAAAADAFDLDAALLEATRLMTGAQNHERKVIIVAGVPRRAPAADLVRRMRTEGIDVFTLELAPQGRRSPMFGGLTPEPRRWIALTPAELPKSAERMIEAINSVVSVTFPLPPALQDGRPIDISVQLGGSLGRYEGPPIVVPLAHPPAAEGTFPWLLVLGVASVIILGVGAALLVRRGRPHVDPVVPSHTLVRTIPLPEPVVVEREPEDDGTFAPPPDWFAAWLFVTDGPAQGRTLTLRRTGTTTIGAANAQIRLDAVGTRPRHAKIVIRGTRVSIVALPEGKTVRVGTDDVETKVLDDGDIIEVGANKLLFKVTA